MSGVPSWAFREPSTKRTAEWTTLCGWMTTSIASSSTSYSQRASTTSRPLFARVAESIVILAPIDHVGWRSACSGVTSRDPAGPSRNGPPEAVRTRAATPAPGLADEALPDRRVLGVDRAEPGERARERVARVVAATSAASARASGITRWPPATSVSLLAVATTLPARERREDRAEADDAAGRDDDQVDVVAGGELDEGVGPATRPCRTGLDAGRGGRVADADDRRAEAGGLLATACRSTARGERDHAERSGSPARTSSAWRPIEPVEPRTATPAAGERRGQRTRRRHRG